MGLGFMGLGFMGLGFRGLGFMGLGGFIEGAPQPQPPTGPNGLK